jgi:hypothetical protein
MAEVTGLRNNALPYPIYGAPFGIVYPMLDADGDLVTGATTPDAEISKNGDTFADCTNESTEIATNSGVYYLLLTATELTCDVAAIIAKSATAGMKTTVSTLYPRKLVTVRSGTSASGGVSTSTIVLDASASAYDDYYNGMVCIATIDSNVEVRVITDYTGSTQTASVSPDWNVAPDNNDTFVVKLPEGAQLPLLDKVYSDTTIIYSDTTVATSQILIVKSDTSDIRSHLVVIQSETTAIQSDTTTLASDLAEGDFSDIISNLTKIYSDTTAIHTQTTAIASDTTTLASDLAEGDFSDILSRLTVTNSQLLIVKSDTSDIKSYLVVIQSETTAIQSDTASLASDLAEADFSDIQSLLTKVYSDTTAIHSDTTHIHSDTTSLASDLAEADFSDLASALTKIYSDTTSIEATSGGAEGDISDVLSRLTVTNSQLLIVKSDTSDIKSALVKVYSDTTVVESDTTLATGTNSLPSQGAPPATATERDMVAYLYKFMRNKITQSSTEFKVYADDESTVDHKATVSDDGTTTTRGEVGTGA